MKLEKDFEKNAIKHLRELPMSYWPNKATLPSVAGQPDRIGCVNGIFCALEFKRSMAEMKGNPLQEYVLEQVKSVGGFSAFACPENWDMVFDELRSYCGV
jgi:hypothetical protein